MFKQYQLINYLTLIIIHRPLFISNLKIALKALLKQKSNHFIEPAKDFLLVRKWQKCTTEFSK